MTKPFSVSQNHSSQVNKPFSDFINGKLSPSHVVNYTIEQGSEYKSIGQRGKGFAITTQGLLRTNYSFTYPALTLAEVTELISYESAIASDLELLVFNDPSDNYVFDYGENGVRQYGVLREIYGFNNYRAFKVYEAGNKKTFYPIYFFDSTSEIRIDGSLSGSWSVDRETGIFTPIGSGTNLTGLSFETDLYYKLVRVKAPLDVEHRAASGILSELSSPTSNVELPIECEQTFSVSMQLEDVYLTEQIMNVVTKYSNTADLLPFLDLTKYQNELKIAHKYNQVSKKLGSNDFYKKLTTGSSTPVSQITVPSREQGVKELNYWKTIYLATSGGSFFINN